MRHLFVLLILGFAIWNGAKAQTSFNKIDSTLKAGKVGYRVECKNKNVDQNQLTIRPLGFGTEAREMSFPVKGRVARTEITDLNDDGYPDLVIIIYSDSSKAIGTVYAFLSEANKTITPCVLPDIMLNGKLNTGYKGHDTFSLMESYLMQKFPVYKAGDAADAPSGGTRVILYQLVRNKEGGFSFNIVRNYDTQ